MRCCVDPLNPQPRTLPGARSEVRLHPNSGHRVPRKGTVSRAGCSPQRLLRLALTQSIAAPALEG